jgi:hypothetical protein
MDLKDSIKARLYDMKYTPFLASYIFFWVYFNAKQILIFTTDKLSINDKIDMLSYGAIDIKTPLYYALAYTLILPIFTAGFYYVTLQYRRLMNYIKQKIEDVTPLPQKEANEIKAKNADLEIELDEKINELNKIKNKFEDKEQLLISKYATKTTELEDSYTKKLEVNTKDLKAQLDKANTTIMDKNAEIKQKDKKISEINKQLEVFQDTEKSKNNFGLGNGVKNIQINGALTKLHGNREMFENVFGKSTDIPIKITTDEKTLLKIIYENDLPNAVMDTYVARLLKESTFKRVKIQSLLSSLETKGLITLSSGYYDTSDKGRKIMLELFDKE